MSVFDDFCANYLDFASLEYVEYRKEEYKELFKKEKIDEKLDEYIEKRKVREDREEMQKKWELFKEEVLKPLSFLDLEERQSALVKKLEKRGVSKPGYRITRYINRRKNEAKAKGSLLREVLGVRAMKILDQTWLNHKPKVEWYKPLCSIVGKQEEPEVYLIYDEHGEEIEPPKEISFMLKTTTRS